MTAAVLRTQPLTREADTVAVLGEQTVMVVVRMSIKQVAETGIGGDVQIWGGAGTTFYVLEVDCI